MNIGAVLLPPFPLLLAPMEDVSDPPFRTICKEQGADLLFSEFISSEGLVKKTQKCRKKLDIFEEERPVGIQLFGGDETKLAMAARIIDLTAPDLLDINFGCPVKGIVCKGAGAGVLKDVPLMVRLAKACVNATNLPVTVKTRLGWDDNSINILEVAERLQDVGVKAITIHGRTRCQMYKGVADWTMIAEVKNNPRMYIPVFGNGDIDGPVKALEYKNRYGVDGIMIGRAAIDYPWIFREVKHFIQTGTTLPPPTVSERIRVCSQHLHRSVKWEGQKGLHAMRGRYARYLKGFPNIEAFIKNLVQLNSLEEISALLQKMHRYYEGMELKSEPLTLHNYHMHLAQ